MGDYRAIVAAGRRAAESLDAAADRRSAAVLTASSTRAAVAAVDETGAVEKGWQPYGTLPAAKPQPKAMAICVGLI